MTDSSKTKKLKEHNPQRWDRRPWPEHGDNSIDELYRSVGEALSYWERYEALLMLLFLALIETNSKGAKRAYSAIRAFEGRQIMLQAASKAYFQQTQKFKDLQGLVDKIIGQSLNWAARRNDIAHGVVDNFFHKEPSKHPRLEIQEYCLYPPFVSYKERSLFDMPSYAYSSVEILYYRQCFKDLQIPLLRIVQTLTARDDPS